MQINKVHCLFEEWKTVDDFDGIYQVSNMGRVKSIDHVVKNGRGKRIAKGKILKPHKSCHGYLFVKTSKKFGSKHLAVHRLVAKAFLDNPYNYPDVNHKDEVKDNNVVTNLEWCNHSYNALYGTCQERLLKYKQKKVNMIDANSGKIIRAFDSMKSVEEELGICKTQISMVCRGKRRTAGGYIWEYAK